jgi:glycosyltransferase involved in cell wall biosynthesis
MNITHVISQRPDSTGSGFFLRNMIRLAAADGHENFLVAGMPRGETPLIEGLEEGRCRLVEFSGGDLPFPVPGMSDVMPYPSSVFGSLPQEAIIAYENAFAAKIGAAGKSFRPDIVLSHHLWLVTAVARNHCPHTPLVTVCHSTDLRQFLNCAHLRERVLEPCRRIDRVLALSIDQRRRITELYGIPEDRVDVVGGGYDDGLFYWGTRAPSPPVHLLYAGKISCAKGVDLLLGSCRRLAGEPLHLHLVGSGTGEEAARCLALTENAGIPVTVHGRVDQRSLAALMRSCHVFVLPSLYEGLPLVLLEALASGCRVVATDLPGCRELLAEAGPDLAAFAPLPPRMRVDSLFPEDREDFESRLAQAILAMARRVEASPEPSRQDAQAITSAFTWGAVFERVMKSCRLAAGG